MLAKISAAQKWLLEMELSSSLEAVLLGPHCHPHHGTVFASLPRSNQNTPGGIKTPQNTSLLAWDSSRGNPSCDHHAQSRYSLGAIAGQYTELELPTAKGY